MKKLSTYVERNMYSFVLKVLLTLQIIANFIFIFYNETTPADPADVVLHCGRQMLCLYALIKLLSRPVGEQQLEDQLVIFGDEILWSNLNKKHIFPV